MRRLLLLTVLVVGCAGAVNVGSAQAIADCGTITASTTLTTDCAAPLVVGASGITVNLGGHSVLCNSPFDFDGILIPEGVSSSTVMNGSVRGGTGTCGDGVIVRGDSNQLTSLTANNNIVIAFEIEGSSNSLLAVTGNHNGGAGFATGGLFNTVRLGTFAFNFVGADFEAPGGTITRSRTFGNDLAGIVVAGGPPPGGAQNTTVTLNASFDNSGAGYLLTNNSSRSLLFLNQAYRNGVGIWITSSSNHNSVLVNGSYANTVFDMQDDNANCDSNLWFNNVFSTANQNCIG